MKKIKLVSAAIALSMFVLLSVTASAQKEEKIKQDSKVAKAAFIKADASMQDLFKNAYAYVIFPNVGKGGFIVGGAGGNGTVFQNGAVIGSAKLIQATVGAQVGAQKYSEVIFFENEDALNRFKANKVEFSGQVSAVAAKSGASANAKYTDGVAVFTAEKSGLMAEASVGGQKFTFKSL